MKRVAILFLLSAGCVHLQRPEPLHSRFKRATLQDFVCAQLDNNHLVWGAVAVAAGAIASGGAGVATLLTDTKDRDAVIGSDAVFAAFGAVSGYVASIYAGRWAAKCAKPAMVLTPGIPFTVVPSPSPSVPFTTPSPSPTP